MMVNEPLIDIKSLGTGLKYPSQVYQYFKLKFSPNLNSLSTPSSIIFEELNSVDRTSPSSIIFHQGFDIQLNQGMREGIDRKIKTNNPLIFLR